MNQDNSILESALEYARQGIPVFPCVWGKKIPAVAGGFKAATTDLDKIKEMFGKGRRNIGMPTGDASGVDVVDDDNYHPGGSDFEKLEHALGALPETRTHTTRAGGKQILLKRRAGFEIGSNAGLVGKHVDIRGDGGYVVMPPSWVDADENGPAGFYEVTNDAPLAEMPQAWAERLQAASRKENKKTGEKVTDKNAALSGGVGFTLPDVIERGTRNDTLFRYACHLRMRGVPQDVIESTLRDANAARCKQPMDDDEVMKAARPGKDAGGSAEDVDIWPEPKPVDAPMPAVPEFALGMLPDVFLDYVADQAELMQSPADYIAIPLMVAAAAALGNKLAIAPKARDIGWLLVPVLWGGIVGRPSTLKSPSMDKALKPLELVEASLGAEYEQRKAQYAVDKIRYEVEVATAKKNIKGGGDVALPIEPEEPQPERLIVNDSTVQKLGEILQWSPRGLVVVMDELTGWLATLGAEGQEAARAFYLAAWNGNQTFRIDRIGRGSSVITQLALWIVGGIQPDKIQTYVRQATQGGGGDDGLLQRFQMLVWPDAPKTWKNVDRTPDFEAFNVVEKAFQRLRNLDPVAIGATVQLGGGPAYLHFTDEAQVMFNTWREKLEKSLRNGERHPALESHLGKYRSLAPVLALVIHLVDGGLGPVGKPALRKALKWTEYLYTHAKRVYSSATNAAAHSAKSLADRIKRGKLTSGFTARDVHQKGWAHLATKEDVQGALDWLVDAEWLHASQVHGTGRPKTVYIISPRVAEMS